MANIAQLLTEHIDIWTAAETEKKSGRGRASGNLGSVYGVKKLRELILELAVHGKLVPQDVNDEPAIKLLKRIQAEKAKLSAEGKLKKEKPPEPITDIEKPFKLPKNWEFTRLENISDINGGFAFKSGNYIESGVRVIRISDFDEKGFKNDKIVRYKYSKDLEQYSLAEKNILMAMTGGTVGKCYLVKELLEEMVVNQRVATIKLMPLVSPEYISCVLQTSTVQNVIQEAKNSTNDNISMLDIKEFFIPIPSEAEQERIVAKVDELMALCDQLEQQHSNAQEAHEILVSQLLATLTQSQNATEFNTNWQRIYAHFDVLFNTDASIDALKQTLLQLAVMGKLVPQDPNDEPASELLKRIQAEKTKLIAECKLKKEKPLVAIDEDEKPFALPNGWILCRWNSIAIKIGDIDHKMPDTVSDGIPYVSPRDFYPNNVIDFSRAKQVSKEDYIRLAAKIKPDLGDLIYPRYGTIGENRLVEVQQEFLASYSCAVIKTMNGFINPKYQYIFSISNYCKLQAKAAENKTTQANVGIANIQLYIVPLPPLAEQHRIVAKVDTLMTLCDQLKNRIQQANQQQQAIANVLVAHAVN